RLCAGLWRPELATQGAPRPTRLDAVNRGWVSITRPWHLVSKNTGLGDPAAASADKGRVRMYILVARLGSFLVELANADMNERFPYYQEMGAMRICNVSVLVGLAGL